MELAKGKSKRKDIDEVRLVLKEEGGAKQVLMELVQNAGESNKLESWVKDGAKFVGEIVSFQVSLLVPLYSLTNDF